MFVLCVLRTGVRQPLFLVNESAALSAHAWFCQWLHTVMSVFKSFSYSSLAVTWNRLSQSSTPQSWLIRYVPTVTDIPAGRFTPYASCFAGRTMSFIVVELQKAKLSIRLSFPSSLHGLLRQHMSLSVFYYICDKANSTSFTAEFSNSPWRYREKACIF